MNAKRSKYDVDIFFYYNEGFLHGVMSAYVDDFFRAGPELFKFSMVKSMHKWLASSLSPIKIIQFISALNPESCPFFAGKYQIKWSSWVRFFNIVIWKFILLWIQCW